MTAMALVCHPKVLVGDEHLGMAHEGHRDHHALPHPAAHLVGIVIDPLRRIGNAHELEHLDRAGARRAARQALVHDRGLGDLVAHREHRVERRHRLLEDHRDLVAADRAQLARSEREQIASRELDEAPGSNVPRGLGDEPQHRQGRDGLAAPRLPHDAERLARVEVERDAVDRAGRAAPVLGDEVGLQVPHAQQRLAHAVSLRGSSASRSASPTAFKAMTTSEMASPGKVAHHGATAIFCQQSAIMLPQLGAGEGTPMPRNDSPASSSITLPMPSAADTTIGAAALGRTWRKITRPGSAPSARAAATNSRSRTLNTSARTSRLVPNHPVSPISSTSTASGTCSHSATTISSMNIRGMASPTSTSRISVASTQRRKYPATPPTPTPVVTATSIARAPMPSEIRAP